MPALPVEEPVAHAMAGLISMAAVCMNMAEQTVVINGEQRTFSSKKEMLKQVGGSILARASGPMTLRQLYYRLVAIDLVDNKQSQYDYLGEAIKEARLEGRIPWSRIEDRTRDTAGGDVDLVSVDERFHGNLVWFKNTPDRYEMPRWKGQPHYVEVWVEKEALAGVFASACEDLNVVTFPNRGYTSITLLKQAADRFEEQLQKKVPPTGDRKHGAVLYFGDFDPSGQDIERNIRDKLQSTFGVDVDVERVALTRAQIDEHELPPQPAKRTDSRYKSFVESHGDMAVELDALPPEELRRLIRDAVDGYFNEAYYEENVLPEEHERTEELREMVEWVLDE